MANQNKFATDVSYVGIEIEEDFFPQLMKLSAKNRALTFKNDDIRETMLTNASFVTSIFTLQFMSRRDRFQCIEDIYRALNKGGGFVFAEKTMSPHSMIHDIRTFTYYDFKRENFDYEDIMTKEQELRHMQKPDTRDDLIQMCKDAGFQQVDSFWQNHSFTGFVAIKP
jgi:tRNA (cmo5U34)-methyltransferase